MFLESYFPHLPDLPLRNWSQKEPSPPWYRTEDSISSYGVAALQRSQEFAQRNSSLELLYQATVPRSEDSVLPARCFDPG